MQIEIKKKKISKETKTFEKKKIIKKEKISNKILKKNKLSLFEKLFKKYNLLVKLRECVYCEIETR